MNNNDILSSFRNEQCLKRQRNLSMDTVYDNHDKDSVYDNHVNDSVFETIIKDINKLKLDSQVNNNNDLLQKLFKKVEDLEKNIKKNLNQQNLFDEINKLNIKFEKLQKNIEKNLVEQVSGLQFQINYKSLRWQGKLLNCLEGIGTQTVNLQVGPLRTWGSRK